VQQTMDKAIAELNTIVATLTRPKQRSKTIPGEICFSPDGRMLAQLWKLRLPLLAFALSFQLLENLLFTPAMGLMGGVLLGRPVVDSTALVEFLLSLRGFLVLFLAATVSLTIRLVTAFYRSRRRELGGEPALALVEEEKTSRLVLPGWRRASPRRWCWGSSWRRE